MRSLEEQAKKVARILSSKLKSRTFGGNYETKGLYAYTSGNTRVKLLDAVRISYVEEALSPTANLSESQKEGSLKISHERMTTGSSSILFLNSF